MLRKSSTLRNTRGMTVLLSPRKMYFVSAIDSFV